MDVHPVQVAITVLAIVALLSPLLLWAYQSGRRASATGKTPRFDRVVPQVHLNDTWWRAEFDADDAVSPPVVVTLQLRQVGARVFGEAHSASGERHSFEGLLNGRQLCYVALDDDLRTERSGAVLAEVLPGDAKIVGIRSRWFGPKQGLAMRGATLTRLSGAPSEMEWNVNRYTSRGHP